MVSLSVATSVLLLILIGSLAVYSYSQSQAKARRDSELQTLGDNISRAEDLIQKKDYSNAKKLLEEAFSLARRLDSGTDQIKELLSSPEIVKGAAGFAILDGEWVPDATARAVNEARSRDDPKIKALMQGAQRYLDEKRYEDGRRMCEDALAIIAQHPLAKHPRKVDIEHLRDTIQAQSVAAQMTAAGYVLYGTKWVTPVEKFRLEQIAKGLVEYKGQWMTKDAAFAAEQRDKGLVLYNGKWMTPEAQKLAAGYVRFEGQWVMPAERDRILAEREAQRRAVERQEAEERERRQAEERAERARRAALERRKTDAYRMSQEFIKDKLKAPASAVFQPYDSPKVVVVIDKDGWFLVRAVVDAQNSYGAMLRKTYLCKLRPMNDEKGTWRSSYADLLDE